MKIWHLGLRLALAAAIVYATMPGAVAQRTTVIESIESVPFMIGGIGNGEQALMRKAGKLFDLRIEFSSRKDNEFVVDTELKITDQDGRTVFSVPKAGPMININLPDGDYQVAATYRDETETRTVKVRGRKGQDLYFHWKGTNSSAPQPQ